VLDLDRWIERLGIAVEDISFVKVDVQIRGGCAPRRDAPAPAETRRVADGNRPAAAWGTPGDDRRAVRDARASLHALHRSERSWRAARAAAAEMAAALAYTRNRRMADRRTAVFDGVFTTKVASRAKRAFVVFLQNDRASTTLVEERDCLCCVRVRMMR